MMIYCFEGIKVRSVCRKYALFRHESTKTTWARYFNFGLTTKFCRSLSIVSKMKVFNTVKTKFRNCRLLRAATSFPDIHNLLQYTHFYGIFASTSPFSKGDSSVRFPYQFVNNFYLSSIPAKCSAVRKVISASVVVGKLHQ
jgi:hypothetical protein